MSSMTNAAGLTTGITKTTKEYTTRKLECMLSKAIVGLFVYSPGIEEAELVNSPVRTSAECAS